MNEQDLELLAEYAAALEKQRSNGSASEEAIEYLERQVLNLQTRLLLTLPSHNGKSAKPSGGRMHRLLTHLNPWHPDFHLWTFVIALAVWMMIALLCRILLGG